MARRSNRELDSSGYTLLQFPVEVFKQFTETMLHPRRTYSNEYKLAILKRHLVNGERISDIRDDLVLNPNMVYRWRKQLFENGARAFETDGRSQSQERRESKMRAKLSQKEGVIEELISELITAKKTLGSSKGTLDRTRPARRGH